MSESEKDYKTLVERWAEDQDGVGFPEEESWKDYARRMKAAQEQAKEEQPEA